MSRINQIMNNYVKLEMEYKLHIEQAYNLRQTNAAESDVYEFLAIKLRHKLNKLTFLVNQLTKI